MLHWDKIYMQNDKRIKMKAEDKIPVFTERNSAIDKIYSLIMFLTPHAAISIG